MKKLLNKTETFLYNLKIQEFLYENRYIILIPFLIAVIVNSIDIFTIKFGVDAELYAQSSTNKYINQSRYGSAILYYLFPFARYHMVSQLIGLLSLIFAALLTISKHNLPKNAKFVFVLLFILYPNYIFLQYFYFQFAYNCIGMLLVVIAYRLIEKNKISCYIIATIFLFIGISSYQSNASIFLTVMMINTILNYIENKNIKSAIISIIKNTIFLILSILIYYILIKLDRGSMESYFTDMIKNNNFYSLFIDIIKTMLSSNYHGVDTGNIIVSILFVLFIPYLTHNIFSKNKDYFVFYILFFMFILAIFSLNIVFQNMLMIRTNISHAFYSAFILLLILMLTKNTIIKYITYISVLLICVYQCSNIVKYEMTYYMQDKEDTRHAEYLLTKINEKIPDIYSKKYKIAFYGRIKRQKKLPNFLKNNHVFGASFFALDKNNPTRMFKFMYIHGLYPLNIELIPINSDLEKYIKTLPTYPNPNCISLYNNDTIVVRLSDKDANIK